MENNLTIIVAGPGAGKTYNLKKAVLDCLPELDNNRFCAVITYTNAATEELRRRISADVPIPANVFIGTIHSFLIRFVIEPYGHVINLPTEKNYIEDVTLPYQVKYENRGEKIAKEKYGKQKKAKELSQKGVIAYDMVIEQAKRVLETYPSIVDSLGNRLQYIFIDEYQDNRVYVHQIFEKLLAAKRSMVTVIGDPLQAVFEFSYVHSLIAGEEKGKPNSYAETPMMLYRKCFRDGIDMILPENIRSSENIVSLINRFHIADDKEKQSTPNHNEIPVYFIEGSTPTEIIERYKQLKSKHHIDDLHEKAKNKTQKNFAKDFYLTRLWPKEGTKNNGLKDLWEILHGEASRLEKGVRKNNGLLPEMSRFILAVTGAKRKDFIHLSYDEIYYRRFCFGIVRYLHAEKPSYAELQHKILSTFQNKFGKVNSEIAESANVEKSFDDLLSIISSNSLITQESCYSTIHSAKGLEATSVLAIASSDNQLKKWLDFEKANTDMDDDYRLGYVAFSRARDMLCIACLGNISIETRKKLALLDVKFYPE